MPIAEDLALVDAFLDALDEIRDAAEFERLMLGGKRNLDELLASNRDLADALTIRVYDSDEPPSALDDLRMQRAFEGLQSRHPDVWERVALGEGGA